MWRGASVLPFPTPPPPKEKTGMQKLLAVANVLHCLGSIARLGDRHGFLTSPCNSIQLQNTIRNEHLTRVGVTPSAAGKCINIMKLRFHVWQ